MVAGFRKPSLVLGASVGRGVRVLESGDRVASDGEREVGRFFVALREQSVGVVCGCCRGPVLGLVELSGGG